MTMYENIDLDDILLDLNSADKLIRQAAYTTLVDLGEPVVAHLIDRFPDIAGGARIHVVKALGEIGDQRAAPLLVELVRSEDPHEYIFIPSMAAKSLGLIGAVKPVLDLLEDDRPRPRRMAVMVLGNIGVRHADAVDLVVEELIGVLKASDHKTQQICVEALQKIGTPHALAAIDAWQTRRM
jgi:HEAT repeat protein